MVSGDSCLVECVESCISGEDDEGAIVVGWFAGRFVVGDDGEGCRGGCGLRMERGGWQC